VVRSAFIEYKRPLGLGDGFVVRTWIEEIIANGVTVGFEILRADNRKLASNGRIDYTMVTSATGRATAIPEWIVEKYSI
jgi:acyl-CoA thioester hydrolase/thioesterase-3